LPKNNPSYGPSAISCGFPNGMPPSAIVRSNMRVALPKGAVQVISSHVQAEAFGCDSYVRQGHADVY
jgi:hypothetical protein